MGSDVLLKKTLLLLIGRNLVKIIELKPSQRVKGRYLVKLDDDTILRVTEDIVLDFSLHRGKELTIEEAQTLEQQGEKALLKQKALHLLSRKPVSRKDLEKKLREWDATPEEIEEITGRLEELGLIHDAHYAKLLVENCQRKGYGLGRIKQEFYKHGIPRDLWEDALEECQSHDLAIDRYLQQKLKGQQPDKKQIKKVSDALARRGFGWSDIRSGLLRYEEEQSLETLHLDEAEW